MKILRYVGAAVLLVIALGETVPIYLISSGLLLGQAEESRVYFLGKLGAHLFFLILAIAIAIKLIQGARKIGSKAS